MNVLVMLTKLKNRKLTAAQRKLTLDAALAEMDAQIAHANSSYSAWTTQPFGDERVDQLRAWGREAARLQAQRARILADYHAKEFELALQH